MSTGKLVSVLILPWSLAVAVLFIDHLQNRIPIKPTDDQLVYAASLDSLARGGTMIVLVDSSERLSPRASGSTLRSINTRLPLYLVPTAAVAVRPAKDGLDRDYWTRFEAAFPQAWGWYEVSGIEYSSHDRAVLFYGHHCGWLCGDGGIVELTRSKDGWVVTKVDITWMS